LSFGDFLGELFEKKNRKFALPIGWFLVVVTLLYFFSGGVRIDGSGMDGDSREYSAELLVGVLALSLLIGLLLLAAHWKKREDT